MLRGLCLGAKPILFRAKSYRGQNAPSVSQTRFAPFVGARKRNAVRPAWAQAKRPVCLTGMLRGLCLGAGLIPARETCMEPDKAVRLARNRALSACLGADTAARQTCRDGHVYCKRPNRLPAFTCKPCVLPLAILVECPSAAGNVGEFFASPRTDKRKGRALFVAAKSGGGARLLGFHAHGASFLPPAQVPQSRQAVPLPPGLCACNGMREASSTSRTDPSPPGHSASSWVLCVRRRACKVPSSRPHRPPIPASRSASSWSLCVRRCAPMRAVSRTCGAKFSGVAQKGAPSS